MSSEVRIFGTGCTRSGFEAGFEAKLDSFFCHEPRSISPEVAGFFSGEGVETETGANGRSVPFSDWSGAFFFEAMAPLMAQSLKKPSVQYQSASAVQAQNGTGTQTGTSALSASAG